MLRGEASCCAHLLTAIAGTLSAHEWLQVLRAQQRPLTSCHFRQWGQDLLTEVLDLRQQPVCFRTTVTQASISPMIKALLNVLPNGSSSEHASFDKPLGTCRPQIGIDLGSLDPCDKYRCAFPQSRSPVWHQALILTVTRQMLLSPSDAIQLVFQAQACHPLSAQHDRMHLLDT